MNILFLTHRLPYAPNRGDRIRAYHLLRVLARDHRVHVVSLVHDREEAGRASDVSALGVQVDCARVPRIRNRARALPALATATPLTHVLLDSPELGPMVRRAFTQERPDVVVAYCSGMARLALEAPLDTVPFVLDMVDVDSEKWKELAPAASMPLNWIYRREYQTLRRFEGRAAAAAEATLVVSERERAVMQNLQPGSRVVVVPNGVDLGGFAPPGAPAEGSHVVFCGVFDYPPNVNGAVWLAQQVWPKVRACHPDATLTLVGMNPVRAVLALASDPSVTVTGAVPDVRPFLWQAAVSAAPLLVARGVQNKVLEALAARLPCVVTPQVFEGLPESVRPGCVVAGDAAAFTVAITALLSEGASQRRRRAERAEMAGLTWDQQLRPLSDILTAAGSGSIGSRRRR